MNQKYKVHEVAKDLNIQSNDIIELLQKTFGTTKKYQTALTADELNVIFEKYTQDNQVKSFAGYFAASNKPKEPEKPKVEKPQAQQADTPVEKTAQPAKAEPAQSEQVKETETAEQPKQVQQVQQSQQPKQVQQVQQPQQNRQSNYQGNNQGNRQDNRQSNYQGNNQGNRQDNRQSNYQGNNQGNRQDNRQGNYQGNNQGNRQGNYQGNNQGNRQGSNQNAQNAKTVQQIQPRPIKPVVDASKVKVNDPPKTKVKGEVVQRGEQVTRKVDTRGTYVELDKYNERYERIAPASNMGNDRITKKQKINQKSNKRGKNQFSSKKRETEAEKLQRLELERARKQQLKVFIPDEIVISELASRLKVTATAVIKKLMGLGEMCTINQAIDFDTASLVADEFGAKVEREVIVTIEERLFEEVEDTSENTVPRSPVVVVMGHVDHGKTSLLDRIRQADVTSSEAGGITQHIGAYRVNANGRDITFLDTPGHEAFTSMRARGASITDIAVLVVAADDGIMPQTVEAINHAKAAGVSIIIAVNKMDKEAANPERIKQELTEHELVVEEWGGDTICVPVSAKTGMGIDELLEMINITADVLELKANPDRMAIGTVIEAKLDKGRGPVATVLVRSGTLKTGDAIIAGMSVGRVRVMKNDKGEVVSEAGPSVPVEIMGLSDVPSAGDIFNVVEDEKLARELVDKRRHEAKEEIASLYQKVTLDNLFSQIEQGNIKELPIIVKADVQGTAEAVKQSLEKLSNEEVRVRVIHAAVGAVSESDVMLASASGAIIVGFNVRPNPAAADNAKRDEVDVRLYRIIYDAIDEISTAMKGMLDPKYREVQLGRIEVRNLFRISNVGMVAGSYVLNGKVTRASEIRVVRDGIVIAEDKIISLKRFKDDVKEVTAGYECGITLDKFHDLKEGDIFESFIMEEYRD